MPNNKAFNSHSKPLTSASLFTLGPLGETSMVHVCMRLIIPSSTDRTRGPACNPGLCRLGGRFYIQGGECRAQRPLLVHQWATGLPRAAQGGCERCATTPQRRSPSFTRRPADAHCLPCEDRDLTAPSHTVTTPWGRPGIAPAALPMGTAPYARDDPTAPVPAASRWGRLAHCRRLLIALT